ncbi:hypothetical protein FN846DRAFT_902093 [Sphaerosporella brunnea]|uniref:Uncharacterized protein n=1 Tax=Sphaerosporella brunnea TaxID=1250544 RepID=A0A5J5FB13_9PEZI|nr:hypothetical protein FN846DRAFT_902093 [Sphaerosporella brunnea]
MREYPPSLTKQPWRGLYEAQNSPVCKASSKQPTGILPQRHYPKFLHGAEAFHRQVLKAAMDLRPKRTHKESIRQTKSVKQVMLASTRSCTGGPASVSGATLATPGRPAQELKGPANAAPFWSSPHAILVSLAHSSTPPPQQPSFLLYRFLTAIAKMSSGPHNTRTSTRATPVGDTNPTASASTQPISQGSSSATGAIGPIVTLGTTAAAIGSKLQAVITTLGTDGIRDLLMKTPCPRCLSRYCTPRR